MLCRQCPLHLSFKYMAGHQDKLTCFEDIPLLAQLNVQADLLTKQALHILGSHSAPPLLSPLPGLSWTLLIGSMSVASNLRLSLLDNLSCKEATSYWIQKGQLSPQTAAQVDWSLLGATLQSCPPTHCMWLSKFVSGHSAISTTMAHWKCWDSPSCPLCRAFHETTCHVLQCQDHLRISKWQQMIDELCSWLIQSDTNPDITHYLMLTLQSQGAAPFLLTAWDSCHSATQDQDLIVFLASWLAICCHFGNHLKHHSG